MIGTRQLGGILCLLLLGGPEGQTTPRTQSLAVAEAMIDMQKTLAQVRGHSFKTAVPVATMKGTEVRAFLLEKLKRDYPDERIEREQKTYVHFGFLRPDEDLKTLFVQMLVEQAAGFYDPEEKRLFLVSGRPFPGTALAHELAHALQDQTFGVSAIIDRARDNDDELLAVQSMIEGEAMALSSLYMSMRPGRQDLLEKESAAGPEESSEDGLPKPGRIPEILQANLMFPYTQGMSWASAVVQTGGEAMMDQMFRHPPESSEQILHPEKIQSPRDLPSLIDRRVLAGLDPALAEGGYRMVKINTLGEFNICQLFGGRGDPEAVETASGWDGDLFEILERPGAGSAMIWISVWDSVDDAAEFRARASAWLGQRHPDGTGWRAGATAQPGRVVWLTEGFDPELAQRLESSLQTALPAGVTLR